MTKSRLYLCSIVSAVLVFSGCTINTSEGFFSSYGTTKATKVIDWNYNDSPICEIDPEVKAVNVTNIPAGKTMYLVKRNVGNREIDGKAVRYVTSIKTENRSVSYSLIDFDVENSEDSENGCGTFLIPFYEEKAEARAVSPEDFKPVVVDYDCDKNNTKKIWVDTNSDLTAFALKNATLLAKGTNCYVWGIEGYWTNNTASGKRISRTIAANFAAKFDEFYELVRIVFGEESNESIDGFPLKYCSDTGEMVNIVVYDINAKGTLGYFTNRDYSRINSQSNKGKYFYVDSEYANTQFNETVLTLAHEFQHMIQFNQKTLKNKKTAGNSFNEMMSMLCEDMMQEFLGIEDKNSPKNRTVTFNGRYYNSGITEYRNDEYAGDSYATAYNFGAWLARQFGGAEFVSRLSKNSYVDEEAIVSAVNEINKTKYTIDDLFKMYILALTGSKTYTHNVDAKTTISLPSSKGIYNFPMTAYNIFGVTYALNIYNFASSISYVEKFGNFVYDGYAAEGWRGPMVYKNEVTLNLRPSNGISIHGIKTTDNKAEQVEFSQNGASTLKMYLIIQ